jgi:hypothetical protein
MLEAIEFNGAIGINSLYSFDNTGMIITQVKPKFGTSGMKPKSFITYYLNIKVEIDLVLI